MRYVYNTGAAHPMCRSIVKSMFIMSNCHLSNLLLKVMLPHEFLNASSWESLNMIIKQSVPQPLVIQHRLQNRKSKMYIH